MLKQDRHPDPRNRRPAMTKRVFRYLLILISGPPRAGKNRAGVCLNEWLGGDHFALSNQLKRMTHTYFGLGNELPPLHFEDIKDLPAPQFGGLTPRQAYIRFSEEIMKPRFGSEYLGLVASQRVARNRDLGRVSVVSGVGFAEEIAPLIEAAGHSHTLHIRVRPIGGGDGSGADSREDLDLSRMGVDTIELTNRNCEQLIFDLEQSLQWMR